MRNSLISKLQTSNRQPTSRLPPGLENVFKNAHSPWLPRNITQGYQNECTKCTRAKTEPTLWLVRAGCPNQPQSCGVLLISRRVLVWTQLGSTCIFLHQQISEKTLMSMRWVVHGCLSQREIMKLHRTHSTLSAQAPLVERLCKPSSTTKTTSTAAYRLVTVVPLQGSYPNRRASTYQCEGLDFALQFADNQAGAPVQIELGHAHVGIDVIPDVDGVRPDSPQINLTLG